MGQPLEAHIRNLQELYWSEVDPDGRAFVPLADALRKAGQHVEAHRVLREGLERHPDFSSGHVVYGWVRQDRGQLDEAESSFREALALDSRNTQALRGLTELLLERGELPEALGLLEVLRDEDPTDGSLPERIQGLRAEVETLATQPHGPVGHEVSPWDQSEGVEDEVDLAAATLQADRSRVGEEVEEPASVPVPGVVEYDEPLPESDELHHGLVTPTLGEIYLRQGLFRQAEEVFEALLEERPGDEKLQRRLEEVRSRWRENEIPKSDLGDEAPGDLRSATLLSSKAQRDQKQEAPHTSAKAVEEGLPEGLDPEEVVSIELLAPDRQRRVPPQESAPEEPVPVDALASDEPISIQALAPDEPISIQALAPDEPISIEALAPDGPISVQALAPDEPISIQALAPDEPVSIEALAPDEPVSIQALAPDEPISIQALAPDRPRSTDPMTPGDSGIYDPGEAL